MSYFDFAMSEIHGLRIKELINEKAANRAGQSWIDPKRGQLVLVSKFFVSYETHDAY